MFGGSSVCTVDGYVLFVFDLKFVWFGSCFCSCIFVVRSAVRFDGSPVCAIDGYTFFVIKV